MATIMSNTGEESQLLQTIEMFEVIVQSQPHDCQSLEILKEAYMKLGREQDVIRTSKRIAEAYTQMGQLSSAILEYETVLQRRPNDTDVQMALKQIEDKASHATTQSSVVEPAALTQPPDEARMRRRTRAAAEAIDDGQAVMRKIFADSRVISAGEFDLCWHVPDLATPPEDVVEPFIQTLNDKKIMPVEQSLKLLADKSRAGYLPLDKYDVDADLMRGFPSDACRRWCVVPFDRMSKSVLVATANPFNQQAAKEVAAATSHRLLWYLSPPADLMKIIRRVFH
jgi:tetratricopeptide (TPR) repeat protein